MYIRYKKIKYILIITVLVLAVLVVMNNSLSILRMVYPLKYEEYVYKYSSVNNPDKPDPYLVFAVIKAESNFKDTATSNKNAMGLMQITEETGEWIATKLGITGFHTNDLYDPETNIRFGCWYLNNLMREFDNEDLVIAAYNGGRGNVKEWLKNPKYSNTGSNLDKIPFKETDGFLKKVKHYKSLYIKIYQEK